MVRAVPEAMHRGGGAAFCLPKNAGILDASGRPREIGKAFERSAPIEPHLPAGRTGQRAGGRFVRPVNGAVRQQGDLSQMIWKLPEIINHLSDYLELVAGDVILTGTPPGVGPLQRGDVPEARIEGLVSLPVKAV